MGVWVMPDAIPYYKPVAPEIPVVDNTAAKIIAGTDLAGSFFRGLSTFAQINQNKQRQELELKQLAQNMSLKEQDFALRSKALDQNYQLKKDGGPLQDELMNARIDWLRSKTAANGNTATNVLAYQKSVSDEVAAFQAELKKRDLLNPNPKNPMQAYSEYADVANQFQNAQIPEIQSTLKDLKSRFDGTKIPISAYGASKDAEGKFIGGGPKSFSPGQIVSQLQDPQTADIMTKSLEASGVLTPETTKLADGTSATVSYKRADWLQNWLDEAQGVTMKPHTTARPPVATMSKWMAASSVGAPPDNGSAPQKVRVSRQVNGQWQSGFIPSSQLDAAIAKGYKQVGGTAPSATAASGVVDGTSADTSGGTDTSAADDTGTSDTDPTDDQ